MDEGIELSLTIAQIIQRLRGSHLHSQIERQAKECLHQPDVKLESLKEDVRSFLKTSGWERKLQNAVYRELHIQLPPRHPPAPPEHLKEPLVYMRKAQASWEKRVLKSLNSMSTELGVPLAHMRPAAEQKELTNKWNEMGTDEPGLKTLPRRFGLEQSAFYDRLVLMRPGAAVFIASLAHLKTRSATSAFAS